MSKRINEAKLGETFDFLRLVWANAHALETRSLRMQKALGLSGPQRLVIRLVGKFTGISPGELALALHLHPSTLSTQLRRLESQELIARDVDKTDARRQSLRLTTKGKQLDKPNKLTIESAVHRALKSSSASEIEAAKQVLGRLIACLEDEAK